jgi:hypothetical protein
MPHGLHRALGRAAWATALVTSVTTAAFWPGMARAEPRFGDSTWVAPSIEIEGSPSDPGPRVAERDHERVWETALRAPFRIGFYPLRLVARGIEATGPLVERFFPPGDLFGHAKAKRGLQFSPEILGVTVAAPQFAGPGSRMALTGAWTLSDSRKVKFRGVVGDGVSSVGAGVDAFFEHKPNRPFWGIGNSSPVDKTYFFRSTKLASLYSFAGRSHLRRIRVMLGASDMDVGRGYGASPQAADVFDPAEVPFLARDSRFWWFGSSADFAALDDSLAPSRGLHFRPEVRRYTDNDGSDVRYDQWRLEARGYLPVFAKRRVLVGRVVYEGVDRRPGSVPIPFYRLPESTDDDRFAGYPSGRFRDQRLALGRLEYRWEIERPVSAFLLGELGEVAPTSGQLSLRSAHPSLGGGLRAKIGEMEAGRIEIARGHEGWTIRTDLGVDF